MDREEEVPVGVHHNYFNDLIEQIEEVTNGILSFVQLKICNGEWVATIHRFGKEAEQVKGNLAKKIADIVMSFTSRLADVILIDRNASEVDLI